MSSNLNYLRPSNLNSIGIEIPNACNSIFLNSRLIFFIEFSPKLVFETTTTLSCIKTIGKACTFIVTNSYTNTSYK